MARVSISIPDEVLEEVDSNLDYGDSRSQWVQEAIELKLAQERDSENRNPADLALAG